MLQFFFSPIGRIQQYEFTLGWLFWLGLELGCLCGFAASSIGSLQQTYWFTASMIASGLSTVSVTLIGMKRLRDAGLPVWAAVVLLVPGLSIMALLMMSKIPSQNKRVDR